MLLPIIIWKRCADPITYTLDVMLNHVSCCSLSAARPADRVEQEVGSVRSTDLPICRSPDLDYPFPLAMPYMLKEIIRSEIRWRMLTSEIDAQDAGSSGGGNAPPPSRITYEAACRAVKQVVAERLVATNAK